MPSPRQRREERRKRILQAQAKAQTTPIDAALKFLQILTANYPKPVVLYCRASTRKMLWEGRLQDQIDEAKRLLSLLGIQAIAVYSGVESGKINKPRPILKRALAYARKHGAILVAISRDRFIRPTLFNGHWECGPPSEADYQALVDMAGGVSLFTICAPDMEPRGIRGLYIQRGQNKGNRERPKRRKARLLGMAKRLRNEGKSYGVIADYLGVPKPTVYGWLS